MAASDVLLSRCEEAASKRKARWSIFQDYRRVLAMKDLDGVIVATNEHWHVLPALQACQAGKDVYGRGSVTSGDGGGRAGSTSGDGDEGD